MLQIQRQEMTIIVKCVRKHNGPAHKLRNACLEITGKLNSSLNLQIKQSEGELGPLDKVIM